MCGSCLQEGVQKTLPFRYNVSLNTDTHAFVPEEPADDADKMNLAPPVFGAVFKKKFEELPKWPTTLVWEVELDLTPPATIRPLKPKLWFTAAFELLPADKTLYKLK